MAILRDIPISLDPDTVLAARQPRRRRGSGPQTAMVKAVQRAIDLAQPLYAPAVVYVELEIQEVDKERVTLASTNGQRALQVGPHADLLAPATTLLAAVYTIGPALEAHVDRLNRTGETLVAYWLDSVGVMALGQVGETVRCLAEERAAGRGWGVSAALSPGSLVGWSLQGQRELCALLPLSDIGLQLNKHCVLEPHKSASVAIGLGPGYESHQVGSMCRLCALANSCWRRR